LLNGEAFEMFKAVLEAQIGSNNITVTCFINYMKEFVTSMCPTDVGEDITNWLLGNQLFSTIPTHSSQHKF